MIIFIHIPKTAGTSFRVAAAKCIPSERILCDYGPHAKETSPLISEYFYSGSPSVTLENFRKIIVDRNIQLISGHFPARKYKQIFPCATCIAFVREPLQRCFSEYLHHKRYNGEQRPFDEFIREARFINQQSNMLEGVDPKALFIGITEYYEKSIRAINKRHGLRLAVLKKNRFRRNLLHVYNDRDIPPEQAKIFYELNKNDVELYQQQRQFFEKTIATPSVGKGIFEKIKHLAGLT